jgi:medium-chain acyl-[acyl-carrier-protein] hydrolase
MKNPWLAHVKPNPAAALRLFCFPYAGGDPSAFLSWPAALPASVEVCPVLLPGHGSRIAEPLFLSIADLVPPLAEGLLPSLHRPFALFGHSTGALIAFEFARALRAEHGLSPARLCVSACGAPHLPPDRPDPIHHLPEQEFIEKLRAFGGVSEAALAEPELRGLILPILRADFQLSETYSCAPDVPLACPISAFGGAQDPFVRPESLEAWRDQTTSAFSLRLFPGGHMFLHTDRRLLLEVLAGQILDMLDRV